MGLRYRDLPVKHVRGTQLHNWKQEILRTLLCWAGCRRALDYYNKAARNSPNNWALQQELAQLLLRLKHYEGAEKVRKGQLRSKVGRAGGEAAEKPAVEGTPHLPAEQPWLVG